MQELPCKSWKFPGAGGRFRAITGGAGVWMVPLLLPFHRFFNFCHQFAWTYLECACNFPQSFKICLSCLCHDKYSSNACSVNVMLVPIGKPLQLIHGLDHYLALTNLLNAFVQGPHIAFAIKWVRVISILCA